MPLAFGPNIVEGKVYRGKRKTDDDDEKQALRELQAILAVKNRRSCDCEAQIHELLENCLNCGRLTCDSEGPGKCFSCGNIVLNEDQRARIGKHIEISQTLSNSGTSTRAREPVRTRIIDDQYDQFAIDSKKHLKEEDRRKLRENLEELQAKRYQRKYMLDIDVDNLEANSRSEPLVEDYRVELQKLQLSHQPEGNTTHILAQLVHQESKNKYSLVYISQNDVKKKQAAKKEGATVETMKNPQKPKPKQKPQFKSLPHVQQHTTRTKVDKKNAWTSKSNKDKNGKS